MYLLIKINLVKKLKIYVVSHFEPSSLMCKMTIMPLKRVSGHDKYTYISLKHGG